MKRNTNKEITCFTIVLLTFSILFSTQSDGCTIVSAVARNGHVWNINNEDGPFGVANFINVFPKSGSAKYGYYTLSYLSPEFGKGGNIQGGMNEAGLIFDFNAIDFVKDFDLKAKKSFPQGDEAILPYILANMNSVQEVIDFFKTYWFQNGFRSAQMHVADRSGRFAMISASGILLVDKGQPLVSTNFDICGKEDGSKCWRYPIAMSKISKDEIGLMAMMSIALETAQKNGATMYTNIQNLTTGDIWFFSQHDPNVIVEINIGQMLLKGAKFYSFNDLKSLIEHRPLYTWHKPIRKQIGDELKQKYMGNYENSFAGNITVKNHKEGIQITYADGRTEVFHPESESKYFISEADVYVAFSFDEEAKRKAMNMYENGCWIFRAWIAN
jgi:hypothetical protein